MANPGTNIVRVLKDSGEFIFVLDAPNSQPAKKWSESALLNKTARLFLFAEASRSRNGPNAHFVQVPQQVGRILIDAIGAGSTEFVLTIATGKQSNAKSIGATRCEQVPNAVANNDGLMNRNAQTFGGGEKQVGVGLGAIHLIAGDHGNVGRNVQQLQHGLRACSASARSD